MSPAALITPAPTPAAPAADVDLKALLRINRDGFSRAKLSAMSRMRAGRTLRLPNKKAWRCTYVWPCTP